MVTDDLIRELEAEMLKAAEDLDFERAAMLRDKVHRMKKKVGQAVPEDKGSDAPGFSRKNRRRRSKRQK